jgi:hypothetical protein
MQLVNELTDSVHGIGHGVCSGLRQRLTSEAHAVGASGGVAPPGRPGSGMAEWGSGGRRVSTRYLTLPATIRSDRHSWHDAPGDTTQPGQG